MKLRPRDRASKKKELNAEQLQSLDWTRSIAIRANAGSGKTTVLVERIVQILHNHRDLTLDNIVAITFTRKAGAQLRQRLHEALTRCGDSPTDDDDRQFWRARLDELPRCPIGTIDSLCHRLLKAAIELGMVHDLDPAFGILEGIDRAELLGMAIRRTELKLKDKAEPAHEAWNRWLATQGRRELSHAIRDLLGSYSSPDHCLAALNTFTAMGFETVCGLLRMKALVRLSSEYHVVKQAVQAALDELQGLSTKELAYKSIIKMVEDLNALRNDSTGVSMAFLNRMRETLLTGKGDPKKDKLYVGDEPKSPALHQLMKDWQPLIKAMKFEEPDNDGLDLTQQLIQIYAVAHVEFRNLCREENRYDYHDLAEHVVNLLDQPDCRIRLTKHYRFIMVDEFQDTNQQQWRIVAGLAGIDPMAPVTTDKLMIVGDPQQSIYRFRQADPTVFERIIGLIQAGNQEAKRLKEPTSYDRHLGSVVSSDEQRTGLMRLRKNYRSQTPLPIGIIDRLSFHAFGEVKYTDPQHLEAGLQASTEYTEVVYLYPGPAKETSDDEASDNDGAGDSPDGEPAAEKVDTNQLELVASELILQRQHGFAWKQMAILLRSRRTHLVNLEEVLRQHQIPYQLVGGLGFWQRQEVRDLVCLANCLAKGVDELALFAVLRGPLCGLNDSELLFLSMLGGRKLLTGLHRFTLIQKTDCDWSGFPFDEAKASAMHAAFAQISSDRRTIIQQSAERLDFEGTWRQRVDRMPHSDLLLTALDESAAWGVYTLGPEGERRLANLRLFFDEVRLLESSRTASLVDTARRLTTLVDESTNDEQAELTRDDNDAVQVMTVHAAKGLEFGVVAVVGLERRFNLQGETLMMLDRFQHLRKEERDGEWAATLHGLPVISFRDPDMPLTRVRPLLHQALSKIECELGIEEEARIFHVAITRAERVLILAGAGPKGKTWPRGNTWQKWVHDALNLPSDIADDWQDTANASHRMRVVRTRGDGEVKAPLAPKPEPRFDLRPLRETPRRRIIAATALKDMLKLHRDHPDQWGIRYRHHVQPHVGPFSMQLLGEARSTPTKNLGSLVGTLVHRALEMGKAFPQNAKERQALLLAHAAVLMNDRGSDPDEPGSTDAEAILPTTIAESAEKILKDVLPNNPFHDLLDAPGEPEVDFAIPIGDWIITGRYDRLNQETDGSWQIVDWKTDADEAAAIVDKYGDQMKLYALALWESLPSPERPIEIVVHLAMTGTKPPASQLLVFSRAELIDYRKELERILPPR